MSAGTVHLKDWIPALAQEIHGKKWSPNHDFTTHLEAQQEARKLGIQWSADMPADDVESIKTVLRAKYDRYAR